ncbi:acyl-CoA thioesterase [Rhodosalinus halophilus]|jgi:acyl-CoA thioester hydrolase|uniref:Acyl-CoA thioesterase n=1 Tax=Rhodosalinus halophilus TaxID=2259333 RepID=A0A365UDI2_9RHOB|nr:thioesterase family protein [Rhodosalinus halophilus]RBI87198.1 acyl-CoA thioesterase [Rhodosalinus halophilus]
MPDRAPPGSRADYVAFHTLPTRWADNDAYGHLNNIVHYALFDTAVTLWQMAQGCFDVRGESVRLLVVESGCRYHAEAAFPDTIHAGLRLGRLGRSSWTTELGLFRNEEDAAFAEGFFAQVQVGSESGRPEPLSAEVRAALERIAR